MIENQALVVGAHYAGLTFGLGADWVAAHQLGIEALSVCTALVSASHGQVSDVLPVPADTIDVQIDHILKTSTPRFCVVGAVCDKEGLEYLWARLGTASIPIVIWNVILSGPSGEDLLDCSTETLTSFFPLADLIMINQQDACLLASMQINTLDDVQVAIQRIHKLGASKVIIRGEALPTLFSGPTRQNGDVKSIELFYDGSDFSLFELPFDVERLSFSLSSFQSIYLGSHIDSINPIEDALRGSIVFMGKQYS